MNHLDGRCIAGPFEKLFREVTLCRGNSAVVSFIIHKTISLHFYHRGDVFYSIYIEKEDKNYIGGNDKSIRPRYKYSKKFRGSFRGYGINYYRYLSTYFDRSMKT